MTLRQRRGLVTAALLLLPFVAAGCRGRARDDVATVRFWGFGREGEVVRELVPEFERQNPRIRVEVQQIPWTAAHEKLLTAYVGRSTPDVSQMGNTWIAELAALGALEPLDARLAAAGAIPRGDYFPGIWDSNVVDGKTWGVPWYVDTRVLFYRADLVAATGLPWPPRSWDEWLAVMERIKRDGGPEHYAILLPIDEWAQPVIFGLQTGADLLAAGGGRGHFRDPRFRRAMAFYVDLYARKLAPPLDASGLANLYQQFAEGYFAMVITGPWNLGEFRRRIPADEQDLWATARAAAARGRHAAAGRLDRRRREPGAHARGERPRGRLALDRVPLGAGAAGALLRRDRRPAGAPLGLAAHRARRRSESGAVPDAARQRGAAPQGAGVGAHRHPGRTEVRAGDARRRRPRHRARRARRRRGPRARQAPLDAGPPRRGGRAAMNDSAAEDLRGTRAEARAAWLLLAPALLAIALFFALPLVAALFLSLTDFDIYAIADLDNLRFVGLGNYAQLLREPLFWQALRTTMVYVLLGVPLTLALSLGGALLLNSRLARWRGLLRTVFFAPVVTTLVAVAVVWHYLYHPRFGLFNHMLGALGIPPIDWLGRPGWAMVAITLLAVWRSFGYGLVIYVAGLQAIPRSLYEAAELDGAGSWRQLVDITLPMLRPTTLFVAVITTVGLFQIFAEPYVMTRGGPLNATTSVALMMYQQGFRWWSMGNAAAIAFVLFGMVLLASALQMALRKRSAT